METIESMMNANKYNEKCAEKIRTLKLFIRDAEQKHETKLQISTLKLVLGETELEVI